MKAEIIAVGTEILLGDIVNTNAQYLSKSLADMGILVYHQSVVGDNSERLTEELKTSFKKADIVITTGGLGPTTDDLTKEVGATYFNKKLILHQESLDKIESFFKTLNRPLTENNKKQAYFPEGSIILNNDYGTAPGCIMEYDGKILILLPGPPKENKPMFENYVIPYLKKFQEGTLVSKTLRISGIGESFVATEIAHLIEKKTNPTVAPYAKENEVTLRITAKASNAEEAHKLISPVENEIRDTLKENIYGEGETSLENVVAQMLIEKNLSLSTAESCTGGLLAGRLINYPGISKVFMDGCVTYSNEAKMKRLGVKEETLQIYGAVSKNTAIEMAEGIAKTSNTDIGISSTGIAGPDGGTSEKPVGLVYIGLYIKGKAFVQKLTLPGDRQSVRQRAVSSALDFLRRQLLKYS